MRFAFTDDQLLFRDGVRELLAKEYPPSVVRAAWDDRSGASDAWAALAAMGVIGLTAPEANGGLALAELDLVLLLEESGRAAFAEPVVETTAVVAPLLRDLVAREDDARLGAWLVRIATGDLVATAAAVPLVPASDIADLFVIDDGERLLAVERTAANLVPQTSVDGSRHLASIDVDGAADSVVVLADGPDARSLASTAFDRGALGTAAQLLGLADHLVATTVDYVKQREQFGVPIGSFQAIKHHLANTTLAVEFARPVVYRAAYSMSSGSPDASRDVSMAKCAASDAGTLAVRVALQCHGAIGYTVEYDLHLWMKRTWALAASWGDAAYHRERVAAAVLGPRPQQFD